MFINLSMLSQYYIISNRESIVRIMVEKGDVETENAETVLEPQRQIGTHQRRIQQTRKYNSKVTIPLPFLCKFYKVDKPEVSKMTKINITNYLLLNSSLNPTQDSSELGIDPAQHQRSRYGFNLTEQEKCEEISKMKFKKNLQKYHNPKMTVPS